jgi:hypothetical protein
MCIFRGRILIAPIRAILRELMNICGLAVGISPPVEQKMVS